MKRRGKSDLKLVWKSLINGNSDSNETAQELSLTSAIFFVCFSFLKFCYFCLVGFFKFILCCMT